MCWFEGYLGIGNFASDICGFERESSVIEFAHKSDTSITRHGFADFLKHISRNLLDVANFPTRIIGINLDQLVGEPRF